MSVTGKRGKVRLMPIASAIHDRLEVYLQSRGYASIAAAPAGAFLLARAADSRVQISEYLVYAHDATGGILAGTLYRQVKAFFRLVAKRCEATDTEAAARLRRASTHWLRHTFGTRIVTMTRDVVLGRDLLGHDSIATTSIYLDGDAIRQREAVERLVGSAE